jgi:adenylate cyclase
MPRLVRDPGKPSEERFELKPGPNALGRARENDVVVPHTSLSRQHARLDVEDERVVLIDLKSRNGSFVDGLQVRQCRLKTGDNVRFGDVVFEFVDERPARRSTGADYRSQLKDLLAIPEDERTSALRIRGVAPEKRAEEKLKILLAVSQVLVSPQPLEKLLPKVFDLLFEILEVDRAALLLAREGTSELEPKLTRSLRGTEGDAPIHSERIVRHAFEKGVGILSADAQSDPRFAGSASVLANSIRSSMCVPLKSREEVLGALYVDHLSVPNRYTQEDMEFLEGFASHASIAIENARLSEKLQAEAVKRSSLLRFFPPSVVGALMESPDFGTVTRDADVTVLFSDISGFTAMSSGRPPREIVALLNSYFPVMAEIVFRHEGTLEKYIGDALMAIWGVPVARPDDADRALQCALEMHEALVRFNAAAAGPPLSIHIGLNTGPVAFGNIGSASYVQFAAIGDTTNVASRICNLAAAGETVVSASTVERLTRREVPLEPLEPQTVKGKDEPLVVYRVGRPSAE